MIPIYLFSSKNESNEAVYIVSNQSLYFKTFNVSTEYLFFILLELICFLEGRRGSRSGFGRKRGSGRGRGSDRMFFQTHVSDIIISTLFLRHLPFSPYSFPKRQGIVYVMSVLKTMLSTRFYKPLVTTLKMTMPIEAYFYCVGFIRAVGNLVSVFSSVFFDLYLSAL